MGLLIDGVWFTENPNPKDSSGKFIRKDAAFRNCITKDGEAGPIGEGGFKAEAGRYHLYISHACPWAHRTMIFRKLKGLEDMISYSVVHHYMGEKGWGFQAGEGVIEDPIHGAEYVHQIYQAADANYSGRASVPVLWDKERNTIVSNESSEIIRMFNSAFDDIGALPGDFYPKRFQDEIDVVNARVYETLNNGVYRSGFATTQNAYESAVFPLFETLDWLETRLSDQRYLVGGIITEADWRLFTTLVRFDPVYVGHFKCNLKRIVDYPNLSNYLRDLYQVAGVAETVNMEHIKSHYYGSHDTVNPTGVVPAGPIIDNMKPHDRDRF